MLTQWSKIILWYATANCLNPHPVLKAVNKVSILYKKIKDKTIEIIDVAGSFFDDVGFLERTYSPNYHNFLKNRHMLNDQFSAIWPIVFPSQQFLQLLILYLGSTKRSVCRPRSRCPPNVFTGARRTCRKTIRDRDLASALFSHVVMSPLDWSSSLLLILILFWQVYYHRLSRSFFSFQKVGQFANTEDTFQSDNNYEQVHW